MGSLKDSLDQFMKQQEKCQSMLVSIAAKAGPKTAPTQRKFTSAPALAANTKTAAAPTVKFSNDTERFQHMYRIRKSSVGMQLKLVIDLLQETRLAFTPEEINERTYVDANANKAVFESLRKNSKVLYDGRRFSYKATHDAKGKQELLKLIRKNPEGIAVIDLKDAYPTVMEDLEALKASGEIWLLSNFDSKEDIAYPNDPQVPIKVDDDLKMLFRDVKLPQDMLDIEKDLIKNGMKPVTNTVQRRARAQVHGLPSKPKTKKKKLVISKRTKLTNVHLPDLFQNL